MGPPDRISAHVLNRIGTGLWGTRRRAAIVAYAALLLASHMVRLAQPEAFPADGQQTVRLPTVGGTMAAGDSVWVAYTDSRPANAPDAPVLMLLHGSPLASPAFNRLLPYLKDRYRVVVPDLPGFGGSTLWIPDYSVAAHGAYTAALIDALGLEQVHLVAYSMAGGVALETVARKPARLRSITLLSAIGVQELELLGSYALNHALHAVQLAALWLIQEFVPHFGWMDTALLNRQYARNFYDTDQRPLRALLHAVRPPVLVLHGGDDHFVPLSAAKEHTRLVPQAELVVLDGGHGILFSRPAAVAEKLTTFVDRVELGAAVDRAHAAPERTSAAEGPYDPAANPPAAGLTLVLLFVLIILATLISEDLTCIGAGLLVAQGTIGFVSATLACLTGIYVGDIGLYLLGRLAGRALVIRAPLRWFLDPQTLERGAAWLRRRGPSVIIASRFLPGTRLPVYTAAGLFEMGLARFSVYFLVASILWTPILVGFSVFLGERFMAVFESYRRLALPLALLAMGIVWTALRMLLPLATTRGRRLMLSRWRRLTRWEFWPIWALYPPVVAYILYLGLRYRSLTLFTAANPGMDLGGFVGESKAEILANLRNAGPQLATFEVVEPGISTEERLERIRGFLTAHGLTYPIVVKPDVGERGAGVRIVTDESQLEHILRDRPERQVVQEFAPGLEFGVFYVRRPDEETGHIFAITDKRFPEVVGDGRRTLEELILGDDRAVCMARHFLRAHAGQLDRVPAAGERVRLVSIGTHALGAVFLDGTSLKTPELETAIDRVSRTYPGFHFGRYDIRVPSVEDFQRGEAFKIVELNGVTSEATSIYDPANGLLEAYRVLMRQWRIAFEIGNLHRDRGVRPAGARALLARLFRVRRDRQPVHVRGNPRPGPDSSAHTLPD